MDLHNISLMDLKKYLLDGYYYEYGISINENSIIKFYPNIIELETELNILKENYKKDLALDLFNFIESKSYCEYNEVVKKALIPYIGSFYVAYDKKVAKKNVPLYSFIDNETLDINKTLILINYLRDNDEKITSSSYEDYIETDEYKKILLLIKRIISFYIKQLDKYDSFIESLEPYYNYIREEKERKNKIYDRKKEELAKDIYVFLPNIIKEKLKNKNDYEKSLMLFSSDSLDEPFDIEFFDKKYMDIIMDNNENLVDAQRVIDRQSNFLGRFNKNYLGLRLYPSIQNINNYLKFINTEAKDYLLSDKTVTVIKTLKDKKLNEANKELKDNRKSLDAYLSNTVPVTDKLFMLMFSGIEISNDKNKNEKYFCLKKLCLNNKHGRHNEQK